MDENTGEIYKDFTQAIHYIEMYFQQHGVYLPFFYLIFGKSGWSKFIMIEPTLERLEEYRNKLNQFRNDLKDFKPKSIDNYSICRKCSVMCNKRVLKPNIQQILY